MKAEAFFHRLLRFVRPVIYAKWFRAVRNWGDSLNPYLISCISGRRVRYSSDINRLKYLVAGSMMGSADRNTIVWGTGCISDSISLLEPPKEVCAVRGPLTRDLLVGMGIQVPAVFGDPALLMPRFYDPSVEVRYQVGIVPHYVDANHEWVLRHRDVPGVLVIDVSADIFTFVQQVKMCRFIISSSLHGLICADAYGKPGMWIELSDQVVGDGFKFRDYFASIQRVSYERLRIGPTTTIEDIQSRFVPYELNIDLDLLYRSCPFRRKHMRPSPAS
jgi:pyruvyltransferase